MPDGSDDEDGDEYTCLIWSALESEVGKLHLHVPR